MALKKIGDSNFYNLVKEINEGETFKCYFVNFVKGKVEDKEVTNISVVVAETGEKKTIGTPGNIKYMVERGELEVGGVYTEITRGEDRKYGKKMGSGWDLAQDLDLTLSDAAFDAITPADLSSAKKPAAKFPNVKEAAEKLAAQAAKRA